ncbi:MAG: ABC transporter substrate-binding protein, partial [Rhodocyclaceae bacterium]|nr:ABC transporter substrate-binding protein [Rhodocyclaceae bacterium]
EWAKLPKTYQAAFEAAAAETNIRILADYDAKNPQALGRLIKSGAKLSIFSKDIMDACFATAITVLEETAAKNPEFKKIYEPWKRFRNDEFQWFRVAEQAYAQYALNRPLK